MGLLPFGVVTIGCSPPLLPSPMLPVRPAGRPFVPFSLLISLDSSQTNIGALDEGGGVS